MELRLIRLDDPLYPQELDLRYRILRKPLGMAKGSEVLGYEADCLHLVAVVDDRVIGCVLFHPRSSNRGRLMQMAVDEPWQKTGLGTKLVHRLEHELLDRGFVEVFLHARDHAIGFYEKLGYACVGDPYVEVGIPHSTMERNLTT